MLELNDWVKQEKFAARPWLLFGKGPTFSRRNEFDLESFNKFALNHVVREQKVEVAHIIDVDVIEACGPSLLANCDWLLVPRVPNVKSFPSQYLNITDWCACLPVLAELNKRERLVIYDFSHLDNDDPWTVVARYFSSEAAMEILGRMGVKQIRSLGIDGGIGYSQDFEDLKKQTLLANGQPTFDLQFSRLKEIAEKFTIDYAPLAVPSSVQPSLATASPAPASTTSQHANAPSSTAASSAAEPLNLPSKLQNMEQEIRTLRSELAASNAELQSTVKALGIVTERLGWANNEIAEYRERVLSVERNIHTLYKSKTWKLGRVFTKPADVLKKRLHNNGSEL